MRPRSVPHDVLDEVDELGLLPGDVVVLLDGVEDGPDVLVEVGGLRQDPPQVRRPLEGVRWGER